MAALEVMHAQDSDAWIAAGFVRNMVWDRLSGIAERPLDDIDVLIFDPDDRTSWAPEQALEARLLAAAPEFPWSVRNQARMHIRNRDDAYQDIPHAMAHWLETATSIAVRMTSSGTLEICAPYGLADLFGLILRPTSPGHVKRDELRARADAKGWLKRWPDLAFLRDHPAEPYAGGCFKFSEANQSIL
ncbi:nucleotidyltransferase family protein [Aestuariispira insulae]|uniref:Nucleotidyltransferase-like protein n=1 Tax=Aestuariispira insulae TaxID=1461337 RepID=A0A3D9HWZ6_9PROT|nr:nucleotidyltransferase family protein [Aestuariispira insulae]RED53426.1 hypothetical protein DFP90_101215 [Aestuariispira insulae]